MKRNENDEKAFSLIWFVAADMVVEMCIDLCAHPFVVHGI